RVQPGRIPARADSADATVGRHVGRTAGGCSGHSTSASREAEGPFGRDRPHEEQAPRRTSPAACCRLSVQRNIAPALGYVLIGLELTYSIGSSRDEFDGMTEFDPERP